MHWLAAFLHLVEVAKIVRREDRQAVRRTIGNYRQRNLNVRMANGKKVQRVRIAYVAENFTSHIKFAFFVFRRMIFRSCGSVAISVLLRHERATTGEECEREKERVKKP